jgi:hypothetical protein
MVPQSVVMLCGEAEGAACLLTDGLVVGVGGGDHKLFCCRIEDGVVDVVGGIGQAGKVHGKGNDILRIVHVGVDIQCADLLVCGVEGDGHLVARLSVVLEDDLGDT